MKLTTQDVSVIYNEDNDGIITINSGNFDGISFKYGKVSVDTDPNTNEPCMSFGYQIVSIDQPNDLLEFQDSIAHLLHEMILEQIGSGELQYHGGTDVGLEEVNELIAEAKGSRASKLASETRAFEEANPRNAAQDLIANLGRPAGEMKGRPTEDALSFLDRLAAEGTAAMPKDILR